MARKLPKGRKPEISDLDALSIIRSGINPERKERAVDWSDLEKLLGTAVKSPPPGSFTKKEFERKFQVSKDSSPRMLQKLVEAGHLETGLFRGANCGNVRYWWQAKK